MNRPQRRSVGNTLKNEMKYSPAKAGVLLVWEDPANGKIYVVNGRHRHELALRTGQSHVLAMKLNVPTAEEARVIGAETNISEGHGSTVDAARYFKTARIRTRQDARNRGLPLSEPKVLDGMAMARLHRQILNRVERGEIPEGRAVAIGRATENPAHHEAALRAIARMELRGKRITDGQAESIARQMAEAGTRAEPVQSQARLHGEHSLLREQAEIDDYVLGQMRRSRDRRAFDANGRDHSASQKTSEQNAGPAGQGLQPDQVYTSLVNKSGALNDIRAHAARRLAAGREHPLKVKGEAYFRIRRELQKQFEDGRRMSARSQK
jgi:hypothetical protein